MQVKLWFDWCGLRCWAWTWSCLWTVFCGLLENKLCTNWAVRCCLLLKKKWSMHMEIFVLWTLTALAFKSHWSHYCSLAILCLNQNILFLWPFSLSFFFSFFFFYWLFELNLLKYHSNKNCFSPKYYCFNLMASSNPFWKVTFCYR